MRNKSTRLSAIMTAAALLSSSFAPLITAAEETGEDPYELENYPALLGNDLVRKPSQAGDLQLIDHEGQRVLGDESGNPIQLRGMSTHGLQWFPEIVNDNAFSTLANDWEANMIRLAMYIGEDGYATDESVKEKVYAGIDYAIANDMYVIVDWHVHSPGNPNDEIYSGAKDFFAEIAAAYPNDPHLIYELANEPSSSGGDRGVPNSEAGWLEVKDYSEEIIDMLRDSGNADDNIILVGSPNWSQRPDLAADDPIDDENTMYSLHFYTGTHETADESYPEGTSSDDRPNVMSNARYALENDVALFATEWGTSEADGNNGPYLDKADEWLQFLNDNNISWANWSLTNKNETSGAFTPFELGVTDATDLDPGEDQVWSMEELSVSGEYMRSRIKGIPYEPINRSIRGFSEVVWDFNDGTQQGFVVNADSPEQDITLSNIDNALQISGLNASNDVSEDNYWANVRLSSDNYTPDVDILGTEELTIDVIVEEPATVSIAAIPQNTAHGWVNPQRAVVVTEDDFELQGGGVGYKATVTLSGEDAPALQAIANDTENSLLENMILFVGTEGTDVITLDNITVSGNRELVAEPVEHAPLGESILPSDFEDGTRQGWDWQGGSGVKTELTIQEANGSSALSWEFAYPEVKPSDDWASAPRIMLGEINATREENDFISFDFYLDPIRASEGSIVINLAMAPPELGFWAQGTESFEIDLENLEESMITDDGLYHFEVSFDLDAIAEDKVIESDTLIRDFEFIIQDSESDFAGRAYIDNVRFESEETDTGEDDAPEEDEDTDEGVETPGEDDDNDEETDTPEDDEDKDDVDGTPGEDDDKDKDSDTPGEDKDTDKDDGTPEEDKETDKDEAASGDDEDSVKEDTSKDDDVSDNEEEKSEEDTQGEQLPDTATNIFHYMKWGLVFLISGIGMLGFLAKKVS